MSYNRKTLNFNGSFGEMSLNVSVATTIAVAGTYVKAAGTTTAGSLTNFSMPTNNRLTCTNPVPNRWYQVIVSLSQTTTANNQTLGIQLAKNGVLIPSSINEARANNTPTPVSVFSNDLVQLSNTDFIEVWITNTTAANAVTITRLNLSITEITL